MKKLNETFRKQEPMRQPKVRASWPNSYVKGVYRIIRHESHYQSYHITSVSDIGNTTVMRHF